MKVLVKIHSSPEQLFLVELTDKKVIKEIKELVNRRKYSRAITITLTMGKFEREVDYCELSSLNADLILTRNHAYYDLA